MKNGSLTIVIRVLCDRNITFLTRDGCYVSVCRCRMQIASISCKHMRGGGGGEETSILTIGRDKEKRTLKRMGSFNRMGAL